MGCGKLEHALKHGKDQIQVIAEQTEPGQGVAWVACDKVEHALKHSKDQIKVIAEQAVSQVREVLGLCAMN